MSNAAGSEIWNPEKEMIKVRTEFSPVFKGMIWGIFILIAVSVLASLIVIFLYAKEPEVSALFVRLIQITFGMVLGSSCIFLGVILSWLGITASYSMNIQTETTPVKGAGNFQNVSPGILLILAGAILVGASLYKEIDYTRSTTKYEDGTVIQRKP